MGLTIVELLLAMTITGMIGATVMGVTFSLTNACGSGEEYSDALQNGRHLLLRVGTLGRQAKLVTACSPEAVVFWTGDEVGDGEIHRDELVMIYWDRTGGQSTVRMQRVTGGNPLLRDVVSLHAACQLSHVTALLSQYETFRENVPLAEDVLAFRVSTDTPPPLARAVMIEVTLGNPGRPVTLRSTAALRADATAKVGRSGNQWMLVP
jgi:hypothetical protein